MGSDLTKDISSHYRLTFRKGVLWDISMSLLRFELYIVGKRESPGRI